MKLLQIYFSFKGRLSLEHFWLYWVLPFYGGGAVIIYLLEDVFHYPNISNAIKLFLYAPFLPNAFTLLLAWPFLAVYVKRLHDRNLSGWFLLLRLIPILGSIILFIPIYLTPGTERENWYDPEYRKRHPEEFKNEYHPLTIIVLIFVAFQLFSFFSSKSILSVIYTDGPYYGRVVDAETGEPISGANVAGVWEFNHSEFFYTSRSFADAKETVTDQEGNFYLERNWAYTYWLNTGKLKISDLHVFKSGYDSHPPYMQNRWTEEDIKRRNIAKGTYERKYKKYCEPKKECIVELMQTKTDAERAGATNGALQVFGHEFPVIHRKKIRNYISSLNAEEWLVE